MNCHSSKTELLCVEIFPFQNKFSTYIRLLFSCFQPEQEWWFYMFSQVLSLFLAFIYKSLVEWFLIE